MRTMILCIAIVVAVGGLAISKTLSGQPQPSEVPFVSHVQHDLGARFASVADAEKAGYFRFSNLDASGSISYANLSWQSNDQDHPSQLWYSPDGRLLGADFSVLKSTSPARPAIWGIDPQRWIPFPAHVHYILVDSTGQLSYGHYVMADKFAAAGGDINDPQPATLVKVGLVKSASVVKKMFLFPALWDVPMWVMNNPNGAFANLNPLVGH